MEYVVFGVIYCLPTIIATRRKTQGRSGVICLNLCFGWTIILWFISLYAALKDPSEISFHITQKGRPLPAPEPDESGYNGRYTIHVVGEQYRNENGSSRQDIISQMSLGDPLKLVREQKNAYDSNAIRIDWCDHPIGYVSVKNAKWLAPILDKGNSLAASVADVFVDDIVSDSRSFLNVRLFVDNVPPKGCLNPAISLAEMIEGVDENRKTWRGQKNWLLRAQQDGQDYLNVTWIDKPHKKAIQSLIGFVEKAIECGEKAHVDGKIIKINKPFDKSKYYELELEVVDKPKVKRQNKKHSV